MIYLDNAATTQVYPLLAIKAPKYFKEYFGNPATLYGAGVKSAEVIADAKARIAKIINCSPDEIYFTSGGTESDNWALRGVLDPGDHLVTTSFEHHAVLNTADYLEKNCSVSVSYVNPEPDGIVELKDFINQVQINTKLVSIMLVNNEIGTIQPVKEIAQWAKSKGIIVHTDAVQAVGHMEVDVQRLGVDMLSASGHKFGAPKGCGFLYIRSGTPIKPLLYGGGQQNGLRPGTEDPVKAVMMADALEVYSKRSVLIERLKDYLCEKLLSIKGIHINGSQKNNSGSILNVWIEGVKSETLMMFLAQDDIYVSAGSACNSSVETPSHVLVAIGCSDKRASESIRISLGIENTIKEIDTFIERLKFYINVIREG